MEDVISDTNGEQVGRQEPVPDGTDYRKTVRNTWVMVRKNRGKWIIGERIGGRNRAC